MATDTKTDIVDQCIAFDSGELDDAGLILFAQNLITSGLVNSTGTYQRFVGAIYDAGLITATGEITPAGAEYVDGGE